ncbi:MAG: PKD domain-containing protein [Desulfomonilia bacterium]
MIRSIFNENQEEVGNMGNSEILGAFRKISFVLLLIVLLAGCSKSSSDDAGAEETLSIRINSPSGNKVITQGQSVIFSGEVAGGREPYDFSWSFPEGTPNSSTVEDPGDVTFNTVGAYTCTLTVTDADGDVAIDSVVISVFAPLEAEISKPSGNVTIVVGDSITFEGTGTGGNPPFLYAWDFDGGATNESEEDPGEITFNTVGTYTVTFTVTDFIGNTSTDTVTVTVTPDDLIVTIDTPGNITIPPGSSANFRGTATGGLAPLTYLWTFPGGTPGSSSNEDPGIVIFNTVGTYTCTFKVTDAEGSVSTDTVTVTVATGDLFPSASISSPPGIITTIEVGESVNFQGTATGGDTPLSFAWTFPGGSPGSSSEEDPGNVTFNAVGTYTCTFTVTDADGDVSTDTVDVEVTEVDVSPAASIDLPSGNVRIRPITNVNFQGTATGGNVPLTYSWTFPGGLPGTSSVEDPGNIRFDWEGTYTCTFRVTDKDGDYAEDTVVVTVSLIPEATISSPSDNVTIAQGSSVNFQGSVIGGNRPLSYAWTFPGGSPGSSSEEDPGNVTFNTTGTYTCTFTVTDADVDVSTDSVVVTVTGGDLLPTASISSPSDNVTITEGQTVNFQGSATGGNVPLTYSWAFPGGTPGTSTAEDPGNVTFNTTGTYTCTFTVTDADVDVSTDSVVVTVTGGDLLPTASISSPSDNVTITEGQTVNFQGSATGGNVPLTYSWAFPGGTPGTSTAEDPGNVTFNLEGVYTCTFMVTDADGDESTDSILVLVVSGTNNQLYNGDYLGAQFMDDGDTGSNITLVTAYGDGTLDFETIESSWGNSDSGTATYVVGSDRVMTMASTVHSHTGAITEDGSILMSAHTNWSDGEISLVSLIRESSGLSDSSLNDGYITVCFMEDNLEDGIEDNEIWVVRRTDMSFNGSGVYTDTILSSSDGSSGSSTGTYSVNPSNARITFDGGTSGIVDPNSSFFFILDTDVSDNTLSLTLGVKTSTGMDEGSLQGRYLVGAFGSQPVSISGHTHWSHIAEMVFDGIGGYTYTIWSDSENILDSGTGTYSVADDGALTMDGVECGVVSSYGDLFVCADTNDSDDVLSIRMGLRIEPTNFYGSYIVDYSIGLCGDEQHVWILGNDRNKVDDKYIYIPVTGNSDTMTYESSGDLITRTITIYGNIIIIDEHWEDGEEGYDGHFVLAFSADTNTISITGYIDEYNPEDCDGDVVGSGERVDDGVDNTDFFGSYDIYYTLSEIPPGEDCIEEYILTIGGDPGRITEEDYLYVPGNENAIYYTFIDIDGGLTKRTIIIEGNIITIDESWEHEDEPENEKESNFVFTFSNDYQTIDISGYVDELNPWECDGDVVGTGTRR